jgi:protein involved in temperature-dependent protein secretion
VYLITEAQRQQLLDALKQPAPTLGKTVSAINLLQALAPVSDEREADEALMRQALSCFDKMCGRQPEFVEAAVQKLNARLGTK